MLQFIANPFTPTQTEQGKGWEGKTPDGRRCRVWVHNDGYVIQFPDSKAVDDETVTKQLQFSISKDGLMVLMCLAGIHFGLTVDGPNGEQLYTTEREL